MDEAARRTALVERFATEVRKQNEALALGSSRAGNRHADRYIAAFEELRTLGDPGRDALAVLLNDQRVDVRVMAAAFLLRYKNAEAREVLRAAAKGRGLVAFGASEAIKRWEDGSWSLDPA